MATDHRPDDTPAETVTKWLADRTSLAPLIVDAMRALVDYYVFDWRATAEVESHAAEAARAERDRLRADLEARRAEVARLRSANADYDRVMLKLDGLNNSGAHK
jgi:hypothetical protein